MKIPFDIKYRPQIESGEYKVVIEYDNRTFYARIVCWDLNSTELLACVNYGDREDVLEYDSSGKHIGKSVGRPDLIIITPEPELSEFELKVHEILYSDKPEYSASDPESWKRASSELLPLARKELEPKIKAEALRTRATELTKNLAKSGLDTDSIPYHLIEFMCNLYTCKNWKEIEETAEAYATRIKAAAMKDLPRWKKAVASFGNYSVAPTETGQLCLLIDGYYIMLSDLKKLTGFNE